jgi:hypothetical protein
VFIIENPTLTVQGQIQDYKLGGGGGELKKNSPIGGRHENHIFSNCGGRRENLWAITCEKSRLYAKKSYIFQLQREARNILGYFV